MEIVTIWRLVLGVTVRSTVCIAIVVTNYLSGPVSVVSTDCNKLRKSIAHVLTPSYEICIPRVIDERPIRYNNLKLDGWHLCWRRGGCCRDAVVVCVRWIHYISGAGLLTACGACGWCTGSIVDDVDIKWICGVFNTSPHFGALPYLYRFPIVE